MEPGLLELAYFKGADLSQVTNYQILLDGISEKKNAVLLCTEHPSLPVFFYELCADSSPENVKVFRNQDEAIDWLTEKEKSLN